MQSVCLNVRVLQESVICRTKNATFIVQCGISAAKDEQSLTNLQHSIHEKSNFHQIVISSPSERVRFGKFFVLNSQILSKNSNFP